MLKGSHDGTGIKGKAETQNTDFGNHASNEKNRILQIPMSRKGKKDAIETAYCPPTNTPSHSLHTSLLININNGNIFCKAVANDIH